MYTVLTAPGCALSWCYGVVYRRKIMTTVTGYHSVLSDEMLERFAGRAAAYDRENRFFFEDFEELRQAGYLLIAVPTEFGGLGMSLAEVCQEQRRLALPRRGHGAGDEHAPLLATGIAADLYRAGTARSGGCWRRRPR